MWPGGPDLGPSSSKLIVVDVKDDPIPEEELILIYRWLDSVPFSRSKKVSAHRDFADGVSMAELVAHHIPRIVSLLNYIPACATSKKLENWNHLNSRVFKRIRFHLTPEMIKQIVDARSGMIERVLFSIHNILLLGPLAVVPPSRRLEHVKSRFMNIQGRFNKVRSTVKEDSPKAGTAKKTETCNRYAIPQHSDATSNKGIPRNTATNADISSVFDTSSPTQNGDYYEYDPETEQYSVLVTRPSTASSAEPLRYYAPVTSNTLRPQSANPNHFRIQEDSENNNTLNSGKQHGKFVERRPTARQYPWLPTLETERPPAIARRHGRPNICVEDNETHDVIYCTNVEDDEEEQEEGKGTTESISKHKFKRIRQYEYREEYQLNGVPVAAVVYPYPPPSSPTEQRKFLAGPDKSIEGMIMARGNGKVGF